MKKGLLLFIVFNVSFGYAQTERVYTQAGSTIFNFFFFSEIQERLKKQDSIIYYRSFSEVYPESKRLFLKKGNRSIKDLATFLNNIESMDTITRNDFKYYNISTDLDSTRKDYHFEKDEKGRYHKITCESCKAFLEYNRSGQISKIELNYPDHIAKEEGTKSKFEFQYGKTGSILIKQFYYYGDFSIVIIK